MEEEKDKNNSPEADVIEPGSPESKHETEMPEELQKAMDKIPDRKGNRTIWNVRLEILEI